MNCKRGKASPDAHTKLKLFADSGGYCQNPSCNINLFLALNTTEFHIAEIAHIISVSEDGPRSVNLMNTELKGDFSNLILLCPNCHTQIDKAEKDFPQNLILQWKKEHSQKIHTLFNIRVFQNRQEARNAVLPILNQNQIIFETYGPMTDERFNPESECPKIWLSKVHQSILPNNRKLLSIIDKNSSLLNSYEIKIIELFRQHVLDFETKHINKTEINGLKFPSQLNQIFG